MAEYVNINVEVIPYSFDLKLSGRTYTITINRNSYEDNITLDLELGDKVLVKGKKAVIGQPLFEEFAFDNNGNKNPDFYDEILVFYDLSWENDVLTLRNLNEKVVLYVFESD